MITEDEKMSTEWRIAPDWPEREEAARTWGVSPLIAQLLYNRDITDAAQARSFLQPKLTDLHEPDTLPGSEAAAERIARAVRDREKIVIYGDYDVDGITASAILWHMLRLADADVDLYVPHRLEEGYGLNTGALEKIHEEGARLLISVDCGITACEAARHAREIGLDMIITDHHVQHGELPECCAIVHPTALGDSPNPHLCGAGVAFKLAWVVAQKLSKASKVNPEFREFLLSATGLAALGTIADVVPLTGESIDSYAVGFKLAPRLNAAGRMGHARLAVELLTRAGADRAREIALYLEEQNRARRTLERRITKQAKEMVIAAEMHRDHCRAITLAHEDWHAGVIGIVASRLVDEFHRPVVMISLDNGVGQGSARSIRHFELDLALEQCGAHLLSYGGHRMAAGLKIESGKVDAFREAFAACANNRLTAKDLQPALRVDAEVALADLTDPTVRAILRLGPFGAGNPKPRLASKWLDVEGEPRRVGKTQDHLQFALRDGKVMRKAIGFGLGKHLQDLRDHRRCRVAFQPIINSYRGSTSVELQVADIQFPG